MSNSNTSINTSFNQNFCMVLEYHLSRTFSNSIDKQLKNFWCDGILMPDDLNQIMRKGILITEAWVGYTGQDKYKMIIRFGKCSLGNYKKGLSLTDCLPDEKALNWVMLDIPNQIIELQLL